ncbi:MAG: hypothetical protein JO354_13345, partial [Verrucomicrobia bacterium]|nr:hypothetical protein [Verrucomicrobiota bacterium]
EDYGVLYAALARRLHRLAPELKLGGPSLQNFEDHLLAWPDPAGNSSWMNRLLSTIRSEKVPFDFFSFEFYPFDNVCADAAPQLAEVPERLRAMVSSLRNDGVPSTITWLMTEFGYSVFAGRAEVQLEGALFQADALGTFLSCGGTTGYLYGYEPNYLVDELNCSSWGNLMMLQFARQDGNLFRLATYHSARMITESWLGARGERVGIHAVTTEPSDRNFSVYAIQRANEEWVLMLINKYKDRTVRASVEFVDAGKPAMSFTGKVDMVQFSREQYVWRDQGADGQPVRSEPPSHREVVAHGGFELPPYSLTIVRGNINR